MMSQLERAINLAAKTGDKIIVVDELNDRSSVVMNLDDYEKLLRGQNKGRNGVKNLTEEELLDKINNDIVSWKDANSDRNFSSEIPGFHDIWESEDEDDFEDETEDDENFEKELDFGEDEDEDDSDFIPPHFDAEGNIIPELKDDELEDEPSFVPQGGTAEEREEELPIKIEEPVSNQAKGDEDENVYYYHEPEKTAGEKEADGFTSIKDELKNRQHWEIPEEVKKSAEDIRM